MKIVITGGLGFLGQRLCSTILKGEFLIDSSDVKRTVSEIILFDIVDNPNIADDRITYVSGDISDPVQVDNLITKDVESIFHLAAIVSADAEENFDLGMKINLDGTRNILEAARRLPQPPKVIFTSSIATYGGELPNTVVDATKQSPQTSYGVAKVAGELLVHDYSRKGFIDGRSLRLPTISVRTGLPNKAASTWASSIIREPLSGKDAICPVTEDSFMACMSPKKIVEAFIHAHNLPVEKFSEGRSLLLTGISVSAGEMAEAVERHKGNRTLGKIMWEHNPDIQKIVDGWPKGTFSQRAENLGFPKDDSIDDIVRAFIEDDLDTQIALYGTG
ncbi:NAD-dependent epimerase/dehydratase family protein [Sneathiella marina]|uniref:NAD-dependent epimerase/dehydratase family protein n=1 Tax=Sneathiella marina TaxID=2950108 RepID=A0ABY4W7J6_9PROT|nr:D-erythronate dehydrogenase [Sneathiella marina]USG63018.1 NAD-dependent epimerase/dehydratase family protein [Sneathiella marina]